MEQHHDTVTQNHFLLPEAQAFISRLVDAGSELGCQLREAAALPLRQYLRSLIPIQTGGSNPYLEYVARALADYLSSRNVKGIDDICSHLLSVPVIQQADHSNLLLDQETFLNNYLFALACREANVEIMITSQCSTVSCLSKREPVAGPVFLRTRGRLYKVFGFSKRFFKHASFCGLPSPITMSFEVIDKYDGTRRSDPLLSRFIGRTSTSAPEAYRRCNEEIWAELNHPANVTRIGVDESMTSSLAALHLTDPASPIHRLLFDRKVREAFLAVKRLLVASPKNLAVNRALPDFFWHRKQTRLVPIILLNAESTPNMVLETDGSSVSVEYAPSALAQALRDGILYVDRILAYLVRCLLPGITAVGGTSQQDYVRLYQEMIMETHRQQPFLDESDLESVRQKRLSRLGGAPLLELTPQQSETVQTLGRSTNLEVFAEMFLDEPVAKTIGALRCAQYIDPAKSMVGVA